MVVFVSSFLASFTEATLLIKLVLVVGVIVVGSVTRNLLTSLYKYFIRPPKDLKKLGEWALVTGATDGIGKAYVEAFAKRGISVVLVSRTESKLQALQKEIEDKKYPGVQVKYVAIDYSKFDEAAREKLYKETKDLDIGVLVNNVGMSYRYPRYFHELEQWEIDQLIELNINSTTWMTKLYVEDMAKRGRGAIINLSSIAGLHTQPLLAEYGACKGYVEKFSKSINAEYADRGITCQCHTPAFVATKMSKMRKSFTVPDPDEYVEMSMRFVGHTDSVVQPFWLHALIVAVITTTFPEVYIANSQKATGSKYRKKGLEKDEMIAKGIKPQSRPVSKKTDPLLETMMFWRSKDSKMKGQ